MLCEDLAKRKLIEVGLKLDWIIEKCEGENPFYQMGFTDLLIITREVNEWEGWFAEYEYVVDDLHEVERSAIIVELSRMSYSPGCGAQHILDILQAYKIRTKA